jgi:transposase-like protein
MTSIIDTASEPLETPAAARRLGVSPHTLFKWRSLGCGPVFSRRGRKVVYGVADLEAYERATRVSIRSGKTESAGFTAARVCTP